MLLLHCELKFLTKMMNDVLELTVNQKLKNIQIDHKSTQLLVLRNSELISQLDVRLHTLKNEHRETAVS